MHLLGDTDGLLLPLFLLTLLLDVTAREAPPGNTNTLQHIVDSIVGLHDLCGYARAKALHDGSGIHSAQRMVCRCFRMESSQPTD